MHVVIWKLGSLRSHQGTALLSLLTSDWRAGSAVGFSVPVGNAGWLAPLGSFMSAPAEPIRSSDGLSIELS